MIAPSGSAIQLAALPVAGRFRGGRRARCTEVLVVRRAGGLPVEVVTEIDDDVWRILGDIAAYSCEGPCA